MHNQHPIGLAILLPANAAANAGELSHAARERGIRHIIMVGTAAPAAKGCHWIPAEPTRETALAHCRNCEWVIVLTAPAGADRLDACLRQVASGQESEHVIRQARPASERLPPTPGWTPALGAPALLGVTIITPCYDGIGGEAVRRWRQHTGLPCLTLHAPTDHAAYRLKLMLPELLPRQPVCYFDADWWLLRPLSRLPIEPDTLYAVPDPGVHDPSSFVAVDCARHGIDPAQYVNSGFWLADLASSSVRAGFRAALVALETLEWADYGEQSAWNWAIQKNAIKLCPLAPPLNFFLHAVTHGYASAIPAEIIGLHAAGVKRSEKMTHLKQYAAAFGYQVKQREGRLLPPIPWIVPEQPLDAPEPETDITLMLQPRQFGPLPRTATQETKEHAIREAFFTLGESACFDQRASAKCFLTYRCIDGLIDFDTWANEVERVEFDTAAEPAWLVARWWMSQIMAEYYLHLLVRPVNRFFGSTLQDEMDSELHRALQKWPPQTLNAMRFFALGTYRDWLIEPDAGKAQRDVENAVEALFTMWKEHWNVTDPWQFPYRFEEAHGDLHVLTALMFIARAAGVTGFKDQPWCPLERCAKEGGYFGRCLVKLGELNPERALWK